MWRVLYIFYVLTVVGGVTVSNSSIGKYSSGGSTSSWGGGSSGRSGYSSSGSHK